MVNNKVLESGNVSIQLVEKTSKTGNKYIALHLDFNGYYKLVFLNQAELLLVKSYLDYHSNKKGD